MTDQAPGDITAVPASTEEASPQDDMLRLLVCPADHGDLRLDGQVLVCTTCGRRFPIEDGVPNMLLDDD